MNYITRNSHLWDSENLHSARLWAPLGWWARPSEPYSVLSSWTILRIVKPCSISLALPGQKILKTFQDTSRCFKMFQDVSGLRWLRFKLKPGAGLSSMSTSQPPTEPCLFCCTWQLLPPSVAPLKRVTPRSKLGVWDVSSGKIHHFVAKTWRSMSWSVSPHPKHGCGRGILKNSGLLFKVQKSLFPPLPLGTSVPLVQSTPWPLLVARSSRPWTQVLEHFRAFDLSNYRAECPVSEWQWTNVNQ